jgi:ABC-type multidrug transport system ATPase subunit
MGPVPLWSQSVWLWVGMTAGSQVGVSGHARFAEFPRRGEAQRRHQDLGRGPHAVHALNSVSIEFAAHSFTAIMGPSGSGKSSLLQVAAGREPPSSGSVELAGRELQGLSETR